VLVIESLREYFLGPGRVGGVPIYWLSHLVTRRGHIPYVSQSGSTTDTCGQGMQFALLVTTGNHSGGGIVDWFEPGFLLGFCQSFQVLSHHHGIALLL